MVNLVVSFLAQLIFRSWTFSLRGRTKVTGIEPLGYKPNHQTTSTAPCVHYNDATTESLNSVHQRFSGPGLRPGPLSLGGYPIHVYLDVLAITFNEIFI